MLKSLLAGGLLFLAVLAAAAPNLFRNPAFAAGKNGLPEGWGLSTGNPANCLVRGDGVILGSMVREGLAVTQKELPLKGGERYLLSFDFRRGDAEGELRFRPYFEWTVVQGGREQWSGAYGQEVRPGTEWQSLNLVVNFSKNAGGKQKPYFALKITGAARLEIRHLRLEPLEATPGTVANGDFSRGGYAWLLKNGAEISGNALKLSPGGEAEQRGIMLQTGRRWRLGFRAVGTAGKESESTGYARLDLEVNWPQTRQELHFSEDFMPGMWTARTVEFDSPLKEVPEGMTLRCLNRSRDMIQIDDLKLEPLPVPPLPPVSFYWPDLGPYQALYLSSPPERLRCRVTPAAGTAKTEVSLLDVSGREIVRKEFCAAGDLELPSASLPAGEYRLRAVSSGPAGNALAETVQPFRVYPPARQEVLIGPDLILRFNGKPFLPCFLFDFNDLDAPETLRYMGAMGFNTILGGTSRDLDLYAKYHFKVAGWAGPPKATDPETLRKYRERLIDNYRDLKEHEAFLGYFLADEPAWTGTPIANLEAAYRIIREFDPYHPVWINEAPRGEIGLIAEYGKFCDIFGVDIYPVPPPHPHSGLKNKELSCVGDYAARMRSSVDGRKPVWMTLQGFAWNAHRNLPDPVYPTLDQLRFMVFDSLVNGAQAVGFWGGRSIDNAGFYRDLGETADELYRLSACLLAPESPEFKPVSSNPGIGILARAVGGTHVIVAVNRTGAEQTFELNPGCSGTFSADGNSRPGDRFPDRLPAYGVRIYRDGPLPAPAWPRPAAPEDAGCPMLGNRIAWRTQAKWLWGAAPRRDPSRQTFAFRKSFTVNGELEGAVLTIDGDDEYTPSLNGKPLREKKPAGGCWLIEAFDVTSLLRPGKNVLAVDVTDFSPPGGVAAELELRYRDGRIVKIPSDRSWLVTEGTPANFREPEFDDSSWSPAGEIAPFGEGAWAAQPKLSRRQLSGKALEWHGAR